MPAAVSAAHLRLVSSRHTVLMLAYAGATVVAGLVLVAVALGWFGQPVSALARALNGLIALCLLAAGCYGLLLLQRVRGDTLTVDDTGVRRHGGLRSWHLRWEDVAGVGVRDCSLVTAGDGSLVPRRAPRRIPRRGLRRHAVHLLFDLPDATVAQRARLSAVPGSPPLGCGHRERLVDWSDTTSHGGLAGALHRELAARVPDRYRGILGATRDGHG